MPSNEASGTTYWFFNTNETNGPGAYRRMFLRDVAAIYGYDDGPRTLQGANAGDQVLAYVNNIGIMAVGTVVNGKVVPGASIFISRQGQQQPAEFHLEVRWDAVVLPLDAISVAQAQKAGCNLPVRCTFGKLEQTDKAKKFAEELHKYAVKN